MGEQKKIAFELTVHFSVGPDTVYQTWLNSEGHTAMTGSPAMIDDVSGNAFAAWDGYISGRNLKLVKNREISQTWRTTEFKGDDPDSHLQITLVQTDGGCEMTLVHTNIPEGHTGYEKGWVKHYFEPMASYFQTFASR